MNDRNTETPEDVWLRLTPDQRAGLLAYRQAIARRAGQAGRGASKKRTKAQCQKAQKASMASRMARKRARMAQVKTPQSEAA